MQVGRTAVFEVGGVLFDVLGTPGTNDPTTAVGYRRRHCPGETIRLVWMERTFSVTVKTEETRRATEPKTAPARRGRKPGIPAGLTPEEAQYYHELRRKGKAA